jgi:hypothetical protein
MENTSATIGNKQISKAFFIKDRAGKEIVAVDKKTSRTPMVTPSALSYITPSGKEFIFACEKLTFHKDGAHFTLLSEKDFIELVGVVRQGCGYNTNRLQMCMKFIELGVPIFSDKVVSALKGEIDPSYRDGVATIVCNHKLDEIGAIALIRRQKKDGTKERLELPSYLNAVHLVGSWFGFPDVSCVTATKLFLTDNEIEHFEV